MKSKETPSANTDLSPATGRPDRWLLAVLTLGLLAGMACSWKLWRTREGLPNLPYFSFWKPLPQPWDLVVFFVLTGLLLWGLWGKAGKWVGRGAVLLLLLVALQDQLRWQPWVWQYFLGLSIAFWLPSRGETSELAKMTLQRLVVAATYFWSGFFKLGPGFQHLHTDVFVSPLQGKLAPWIYHALLGMGPVAPWLEMVLGLALLASQGKIRRFAIVGLVGMHIYILVTLSLVAKLPNTVIWPWNVAMMLLLVGLFWRKNHVSWGCLVAPQILPATAAALLLLVVGPLLARSESWDRYLSFQLYSGRERRGLLVMDMAAYAGLPENVQSACTPSAQDASLKELRFLEWCLQEVNVPPPAEPRILLALARHIGTYKRPYGSTLMFYTDYHFLLKEKGWDIFPNEEFAALKTIPPLRRKALP